jgi:hypothetical protein
MTEFGMTCSYPVKGTPNKATQYVEMKVAESNSVMVNAQANALG